ncbi:MAG: hypothetical protein V4538_00360 [Bacteroidota bacterium]
MKSKVLTFVVVLTTFTSVQAQMYETKNYVIIPKDIEVIKTGKVENCNKNIEKGSIVISEQKKKNGEFDVTIIKVDTLKNNKDLPFDKEVEVKFKSLPGYANITVNEKDNSILQVNYWLSKKETIKAGTSIRVIKMKLNCDGKYEVDKQDDKPRILSNDSIVYLCKASESEKSEEWFVNSDIVIEVYKDSKVNHYFVNKYDRNGNYSIKLKNRQYLSYKKKGFEFGAITIPFKYRFEDTKTVNGQEVKANSEFIADANLGLFAGYKFSRYRVRYEGGKLKDLSNLGCTLGGFLNVSSASIDSLSTTFSDNPLKTDEKLSIGLISPGLGAMFTVYNVQIGGFVGWDFGFGQNGKKWNFNGRPWVGFGLGYSLSSFWKK